MTLDEILSQAAGGFNLQALSLDNILRAILVLAVTGAPANYLMAALLCLVLVPVFFYATNLIGKVLKRDEDPDGKDRS